MGDTTCALCGGNVTSTDLTDEREQKIRQHNPQLDDEDMYAKECNGCGHVSYHVTN